MPTKKESWLSGLLDDHLGKYRTAHNVELLLFEGDTIWLFSRYPGQSNRELAQLTLCREFESVQDFQRMFLIDTLDDLNELIADTLVPLYHTGQINIGVYLKARDPRDTCNLLFRKVQSVTYITDQETDEVHVSDDPLCVPNGLINFPLEYAAGHPNPMPALSITKIQKKRITTKHQC